MNLTIIYNLLKLNELACKVTKKSWDVLRQSQLFLIGSWRTHAGRNPPQGRTHAVRPYKGLILVLFLQGVGRAKAGEDQEAAGEGRILVVAEAMVGE